MSDHGSPEFTFITLLIVARARLRRHRQQAPGLALPRRPLARLAQIQESKCTSGEAGGRRGLGEEAVAMIPTPFWFEQELAPEDFQKLGQLSLRWSHTDHIIGNCLKVPLRLTDDEAVSIVFPLSTDRRLSLLKELAKGKALSPDADQALRELWCIMPAIQLVRNNVVHAVVFKSLGNDPLFHLPRAGRSLRPKN
jgi:hypothetical protein